MTKTGKIKRPDTLQLLSYEKIRDLFISGQVKTDEIYSARQFAEMLGVSRTPVREALLRLTAEGLLVSVKRRGFAARRFTEREIRNWFELRRLLEAHLIEKFIEEMREPDLKTLASSIEKMRENIHDVNACTYLEADEEFHMALVRRHGNLLLEAIMTSNRNRIAMFCHRAVSFSGRIQEITAEHERILQALRDKDTKRAIDEMMQHLDLTEKHLIEAL